MGGGASPDRGRLAGAEVNPWGPPVPNAVDRVLAEPSPWLADEGTPLVSNGPTVVAADVDVVSRLEERLLEPRDI